LRKKLNRGFFLPDCDLFYLLPHLERAAILAICLRFLALNFLALALPPLLAPSLLSATALGFLLLGFSGGGFVTRSIISLAICVKSRFFPFPVAMLPLCHA